MGKIDYKEYLQSAAWKHRRVVLLASDNIKCFCCGAEKWMYRIYRCNFCEIKFYGDKWSRTPECECGGELGFTAITDGSEYFQLHHLTYKNFGHEENNELMILCEDCHLLAHHLIRLYRELKPDTVIDYIKKAKHYN